jgi:hypothetical protein
MNARETVNMPAHSELHNLLFCRLHDGGALCVAAVRMLTKDEWRRLIRLIDVQADLGIMAELCALKAQERGTGDSAIDAETENLRAWLQAEADLAAEVEAHKATRAKAEAFQARLDEIECRLAAPVARPLCTSIEAVAEVEDEADVPAPDALVSEGEAVEIADVMAPVIEAAPEVYKSLSEVVETPAKVAGPPETVAEQAEPVDDETDEATADEPAASAAPRAPSGGVAPPRAALELSSGVQLLLPRSLFGIAEAMLVRPCLMAELAKLTAHGNIATTAASVSLLRREVKRQTAAAWAVVREGELYRLARVKPAAAAAVPVSAPKAEPALPAAEAIRPAPLKPLTGAVPIEHGDLIGVNIKIGVVATPAGQYSLDGATKMARTLDLLKGGAMFGLAHIATVGQWRDAETARNALLMERGRLARHGIDIYTDKLNARLRTLEGGA